MNIDEYLNNLQSNLDNHLSRFGVGPQPAENNDSPAEPEDKKFCPECGTQVEADANFCPNCGYNFYEDADEDDAPPTVSDSAPSGWNDSDENEGILWTNTAILADKYGVDREEINGILSSFIKGAEDLGITWHFLDMADCDEDLDGASWMDYSEALQRFIEDEGIQAGPHLSLFIVGGNDVIPQPAAANPCNGNTEWSEDSYDDHVYADVFYCFYGQLALDFLDFRRARCNVARLPLESGMLDTDPDEDLGDYLSYSNRLTEDGGISIGRAVMTSNSDWIPASREMSRNLPTEHMDNEEDVVLDNMFLSPEIMEDMNEDLAERYYEKISEADMLVFNLHGACDPGDSGFYSTGLAFSIDMLQKTGAKVFNTVACWGGRYIKYSREQSMLLSAMYDTEVMLYCGSCVPALGKCGHFQSDGTWRIQPAAYSETFMARFSEYECIGTMNAGEAFLKAKCDYYNSSRMVEEDEYILGTMLMFNLYGNPKLRTVPDTDALADIQQDDGSKQVRVPFRKLNRKVVMQAQKQNDGQKSLLSEVRGLVDSNLRMIHETITRNLYYKLGVEPRELFSVESYETTDIDGNPKKGYLYNYVHSAGPIKSRIQAKVDQKGRLMDAIQTKSYQDTDSSQNAGAGMSLNLGDANAVSGGIHVTDARVDNSVHSTVINNTTVHEAQKTREELEQDNENKFVQAVQGFMADGRLDQNEIQQLNLLAVQYRITPQRADQLIDLVRRSSQASKGTESTDFFARQLVEEVYGAINACQTDVLVRLMPRLEQLALTSANDVVQFYHHLLLASLKPESAVMAMLAARTDNYWQLFWAQVAYVKLGQLDNATGLLPRMGVFGAPQGDTMLLIAIDSLAQYRANPCQDYYLLQAQDKLMQAHQYGMSEPLNALWYAVKEAMMEQPSPEIWFRFYAENTLKGLYPLVATGTSGMSMPGMPPMPQAGALGVNLPQMQGFNPLQAVQQMGFGGLPSMEEMQRQLEAMRGGTPPPMPNK